LVVVDAVALMPANRQRTWRAGMRGARLAPISFIILLITCATAHPPALAGSEWRPTRIGKLTIPARTTLFVRFRSNGEITGFGGCNDFSGEYAVADRSMKITILPITRTQCGDAIAALEVAFLETLRSATAFQRLQVMLTLFDHNSREIAYFAQTDWD
jgi:heat shock protein HslJ